MLGEVRWKVTYKENPKTKGSGIVCCIPQTGRCPMGCSDCFFQSGRSYLDLEADLPNMPDKVEPWQIVRVNDGNDSNCRRQHVINMTERYPLRFYNTSIPANLRDFVEPVVLTLNPGKMTDNDWHLLPDIPENLMFVRIRTNTWNLERVVRPAVEHYTREGVPVVLTFMAYHYKKSIPKNHQINYLPRTRTINKYHAIWRYAWKCVMNEFKENTLVYSCGQEGLTTACKNCGNCAREFMATKERLNETSKTENQ